MQQGKKLQKKGICCHLSSFCCFFLFCQGFSSLSLLCVSFSSLLDKPSFLLCLLVWSRYFRQRRMEHLISYWNSVDVPNIVSDETNTTKKTLLEIKFLKPKVSDFIVEILKRITGELRTPNSCLNMLNPWLIERFS